LKKESGCDIYHFLAAAAETMLLTKSREYRNQSIALNEIEVLIEKIKI
jgi:hypothetical protein